MTVHLYTDRLIPTQQGYKGYFTFFKKRLKSTLKEYVHWQTVHLYSDLSQPNRGTRGTLLYGLLGGWNLVCDLHSVREGHPKSFIKIRAKKKKVFNNFQNIIFLSFLRSYPNPTISQPNRGTRGTSLFSIKRLKSTLKENDHWQTLQLYTDFP